MTGIPARLSGLAGAGSPTDGAAAARPAPIARDHTDNRPASAGERRPPHRGSASTDPTAGRRRVGRHSATATAKISPSATAMTSTSPAPSGMPKTRSESTIKDDINNSFHCVANERRRGQQARRSKPARAGLARSLKQPKESDRPQTGRREDHAFAMRGPSHTKVHKQSHI